MKTKIELMEEFEKTTNNISEIILVELMCDIRDNLAKIAQKLNYIRKIELD
jgi:hypothetical protein